MGMCSSKDKKGTHPSPLVTLDQYGKLAAVRSSRTAIATSHDNHIETEHKLPKTLSTKKPVKSRHRNVKNKKLSNNNNNNAVEIWLPVVSPCRFKASPVPYTVSTSRDLTVDSSQSTSEEAIDDDDDDDVEISSPTSNYYRSPCPPFLYSGYLSGASFSRDLAAALSRENHMGSFAPSPLSNWATSPARRVRRPRPGRRNANVSAHYRGAGSRRQCPSSHPGLVHSNILFTEDHSSSTPLSRSRSLPKRNTKNDNLNILGHNDQPLNIHEEKIILDPRLKSINTSHGKGKMDTLDTKEVTDSSLSIMNPSDDTNSMDLSHGKSIMDSLDGIGIMHPSHGKGNIGSSRKLRELSSQRKAVKDNTCNESHDQEQSQKKDAENKLMHQSNNKGRVALKDRPVNCPSRWDHGGTKENFKNLTTFPDQKVTRKTRPHASDTHKDESLAPKEPSFRNQTNIVHINDSSSSHHECLLDKTPVNVSAACTDSAMDQTLQPNGSMSNRVQSLISAITKFNTEGRVLSEVDESEADWVFMQNDREASKLLKAAARDAFGMSKRDHSGKDIKKSETAPDPGLHASTHFLTQADYEMRTKDDHKNHNMFHADNDNILKMTPEFKSWVEGSVLNKTEGTTARWRTNSSLTNSSTKGVLLKTEKTNNRNHDSEF